ncbi:MAG: helix-turn-helix transcriptional regulator [Duganella sp.]
MNYPIRTLQQLRPLLVGFRKQAGLSQADVAALLGVTQQSYAKIEANPAVTSVERLFTILRLLDGEIVLGKVDAAGQVKKAGMAPALSQAATAPAKVTPPSTKAEHW